MDTHSMPAASKRVDPMRRATLQSTQLHKLRSKASLCTGNTPDEFCNCSSMPGLQILLGPSSLNCLLLQQGNCKRMIKQSANQNKTTSQSNASYPASCKTDLHSPCGVIACYRLDHPSRTHVIAHSSKTSNDVKSTQSVILQFARLPSRS